MDYMASNAMLVWRSWHAIFRSSAMFSNSGNLNGCNALSGSMQRGQQPCCNHLKSLLYCHEQLLWTTLFTQLNLIHFTVVIRLIASLLSQYPSFFNHSRKISARCELSCKTGGHPPPPCEGGFRSDTNYNFTPAESYRFSQQSLALQNIQIIVICQRTCYQLVEVFLGQLQLTANFIHDLVGQIAFPMRIMYPENLLPTNGQPSVVVSSRANLE